MSALIFGLLSNILPGLVSDVAKRVLPAEKMSEADQAQLAQALTLEIMKQDWAGIESEYKDRSDARQLAANEIAKGNALTSFLAATVRPLWGLGAFVLVAWSVARTIPIDPAIRSIIETVLWFYFGGRTIEKIVPTVTGAWSSVKAK